MDKLSPDARSRNMSKVRAGNTKPEMIVRRLLHGLGYRFRLHDKTLPGKPDIVLKRYNSVVFVNGCFWHGHEGCRRATVPSTRTEFWLEKIRRNRQRDSDVQSALMSMGYTVIVVWECDLRDLNTLAEFLDTRLGKKKYGRHD